jgi:hypothetical protein
MAHRVLRRLSRAPRMEIRRQRIAVFVLRAPDEVGGEKGRLSREHRELEQALHFSQCCFELDLERFEIFAVWLVADLDSVGGRQLRQMLTALVRAREHGESTEATAIEPVGAPSDRVSGASYAGGASLTVGRRIDFAQLFVCARGVVGEIAQESSSPESGFELLFGELVDARARKDSNRTGHLHGAVELVLSLGETSAQVVSRSSGPRHVFVIGER